MTDKELYDIFRDYRPALSDEEVFMARLSERMDEADLQKSVRQHRRLRPLRVLPWAAGIAAALIVAFFLIQPSDGFNRKQQTACLSTADYQAWLASSSASFRSYDDAVAEVEACGRQIRKIMNP